MPLFRCNDQIHFFAHVPKCAGRAVEAYLDARFGPLAFVDNEFLGVPRSARWNLTSPQHVDAASFGRLFPGDWIASCFAVVRHPIARVVSAYNFAAEALHTVTDGTGIVDWARACQSAYRTDAPFSDNHFRPQAEMVPEGATVFRMEDGLDAVVAHIDDLSGRVEGARRIAHLPDTHLIERKTVSRTVTQAEIAELARLYAIDFERFDYRIEPAATYTVRVPVANPLRDLPGRVRQSVRRFADKWEAR